MGLINHETPSIPKQKMHEFIWLVTGRNKIGKTTLASSFPEPYFFTFEPGTSGLMTYETDILKTANKLNKPSWLVYKKAVDEFVENDGYGFKTAVTDPYGVAYDECVNYICKREGIAHPSEMEWGKGFRMVSDEFKSVTRKLISNDFTPLIIAHMKNKNRKDGIGGEKDIIDLDISGKSGDFIKNLVDIFLLADFDSDGNRKLFVRPTTNQEAGSRLDFGVDKINLDYEELKEAFKEAIKRNNEKQGITDEIIEKYYEEQRNEEKLSNLIEEIKRIAKQKEMSGAEISDLMKENYGFGKPSNLDLETARDFLSILEDHE